MSIESIPDWWPMLLVIPIFAGIYWMVADAEKKSKQRFGDVYEHGPFDRP